MLNTKFELFIYTSILSRVLLMAVIHGKILSVPNSPTIFLWEFHPVKPIWWTEDVGICKNIWKFWNSSENPTKHPHEA